MQSAEDVSRWSGAAICHVRGKAGCAPPCSDGEHPWAHCPRAEQGWITHGCLHITLLGKIPGVSVCPWDRGVKETPVWQEPVWKATWSPCGGVAGLQRGLKGCWDPQQSLTAAPLPWPLPCTPWAFRGPRALSHGGWVPPEVPVPSGAAGTLTEPRGGHDEVPFLIPGGQRPRRTPVTAASSPLFTSVFSSLITRFIAFARGKPGDGGAGEDAPRQPQHRPGEGGTQSSAGAAPTNTWFGQDLGRGGAEPGPGAPRRALPHSPPSGAASARCTNAISSGGEGKKKKKRRQDRWIFR